MSRLNFISNDELHVATGNIVDAASGITGVWDLKTNDWSATATALTANDRIELVQGKGTATYPLMSNIFEMKGVKQIYTPSVARTVWSQALTVVAAGGVGTIHEIVFVRRATGADYSDMINSPNEDYGFGDQIISVEYVELVGETTTTIALALSKALKIAGLPYGLTASAAVAVITVSATSFGTTFQVRRLLAANTTAAAASFAEGSGSYDQVLSAEKETQAMHGYHGRAGSFLNTPATFASSALTYDCLTLLVEHDNNSAIARENKYVEINIWFTDENAKGAEMAAKFLFTLGTASTKVW
tara:strand:+ start:1110 stop:2012 length:903 start_codon:yes stop_codon:yes gene_type:complete